MSICRNLPNRQKTQCGLSQFCGGCRNIVPSGHVWDIKRRLSRFGHLNGHDPCNDTGYGRDLLMVQSSNQLSGPALKASTEPASHIHVPLFPAAAISNPENPGRQLSCKGSGFNGGADGRRMRVPSHFALGRSPNTCQRRRLVASSIR